FPVGALGTVALMADRALLTWILSRGLPWSKIRKNMARKAANRKPKLPQLLQRKVYKTGQTRGADDDEVFQNRVSRKSTVLLQFNRLDLEGTPPDGAVAFEQGFIVLIDPEVYFGTHDIENVLADKGLELGVN